jgi:glycerophosphoryl diester phosphodiesterase
LDTDIRKFKSLGKKVNVFTVNSHDEMEKFVELGVDGIFTDFPQRFGGKIPKN